MKGMKSKYSGKIGMQYKYFSINSKEAQYDSEKRIITGYAAVFGNKDKAGDILVKGCFSKSIQERGPESNANDKILLLWMHNMDEPIGFPILLREDEKGLYFEAYVDEIELGDRAIKQLESGTLNQFSIGYQYVWDNCKWDEEQQALIVREVKLHELSVVSFGCNAETEYLGLKSQEDYDKAYRQLNDEISSLCSNIGSAKQQKIQKIIAKAMSLASFRPELGQAAPGQEKADKSMFNNFKLKKQD